MNSRVSHRRAWRRRAAWLGCCVLAGCGSSPPTRFYILTDVAGPTPAASAPADSAPAAAAGSAKALQVGPVTIAPEIDRPQLVTRAGTNRIQVADFERWAAPLADQIQRVLSDDLASRLAPGLVLPIDQPTTGQAHRTLSVAIEEFYGDSRCAVSLRAAWTLAAPNASPLQGSERLQLPPSAPCDGELPAAMSRALAMLADRLSIVISTD